MQYDRPHDTEKLLAGLGELWTVRPIVSTVSEMQNIHSLIYRSNGVMQERFAALGIDYPMFRSIRGDGNCFYRSMAFLYLRKHPYLMDCRVVFPKLDEISMGICLNCPQQFRGIIDSDAAKYQLARGWNTLFNGRQFQTQTQQQAYLTYVLNRSWLLDTLIIVYFRSINHKYIKDNYHRIREFNIESQAEEHTLATTLTRVATFGEDSQDVELETLAMCLDTNIQIMFVREDTSVPVLFQNNQIGHSDLKVLLLTPGHYDILYSRMDYESIAAEQMKMSRHSYSRHSLERPQQREPARHHDYSPPPRQTYAYQQADTRDYSTQNSARKSAARTIMPDSTMNPVNTTLFPSRTRESTHQSNRSDRDSSGNRSSFITREPIFSKPRNSGLATIVEEQTERLPATLTEVIGWPTPTTQQPMIEQPVERNRTDSEDVHRSSSAPMLWNPNSGVVDEGSQRKHREDQAKSAAYLNSQGGQQNMKKVTYFLLYTAVVLLGIFAAKQLWPTSSVPS